ncbi:MAG: DUF1761 domain-containing protein [Parvularculaceae bacterium]|nr:DUF1761 domain-containing protein [Parvularculaceae bacterium]
MIYILQNFLTILAGTVAAFAFGAVYYSSLSKPWMAAAKLSEDDIKAKTGLAAAAPYIIAFLCEFWIAAILAGALILAPEEAGEWTMAIGTAIVLWVGFIAPAMLVNNRYHMEPLSLFGINAGHWLGVLIIQAVVMQAIGVTPPTA